MKAFRTAVAKVISYKVHLQNKAGVVIAGGDGEGSPILNDTVICFNGDARKGLDHETFLVELPDQKEREGFGFCKTARKPYDTLVCLALISLFEEINDPAIFGFSSDGDERDWLEAKKIYRAFNHKDPVPLKDAEPQRIP